MIALLLCQRYFERKNWIMKKQYQPEESAFDLTSLLGYRLLRLSTSIGNLAGREATEVAGLTLPEYRVLVVLHSRGPSGVVALQQAMLIDKAWISRTLASLVKKLLVASRAEATDARRTLYSVTPTGQRAAQALIEQSLARQKRLMRGVTAEESRLFLRLLKKVQANVDSEQS
jgi:DNA-binding MarR family transcriptional regulator